MKLKHKQQGAMCKIGRDIAEQDWNKLQLKHIEKNNNFEIISISLEKGAVFPEHSSPTDAQLVVLEGEIIFNINKESYQLKKHQNIGFSKEVKHSVSAKENSKFLIIR